MKYSYNWLKELSGTKKTPAQIADMINMRAFELEDTKKVGGDTQLEFNVLPNRGHDALSHIGLVREICAVEGRQFLLRSHLRSVLRCDLWLKIEIKDKKLCPRYIGAIIENIKVAPSPKWMQERLLVSGVKPINNIVDITNYVMLETGQPFHAFDAEKTTGNIVVRRAKRGEKIKLLDEKEYELIENNLVIADSEKALALAGVMGGLHSSVAKKTKTIILESANFNAANIRKTRTGLGIQTESSYRFEREIDPNLAEMGAARAIGLLRKYGGKNVKLTAYADIYPKKIKSWDIKLDPEYVKSLLGENIPAAKMKNILENLGLGIKLAGKILKCEIPTRRIDLRTQEDLIEEIGRIYGYENIQEKPALVSLTPPRANEKRNFENKLRDILAGLGFSEVYNYSFYSADDISKCNLKVEDHIEVANPMNPEQQYMRTSLIPGLIKNVKFNLKYFNRFSIFEIGRKFKKENEEVKEIDCFAGVLVDNSAKDNLFFILKGRIEALFSEIGFQNTKYQIPDTRYKYWHPSRTAEIIANGQKIGKVGEINPQVLNSYGIKQRVAVFGIKTDELLKVSRSEKIFESIPRFPSIKRDISMFIPENIDYAKIENTIRKSGGELVKRVELFDTFQNSLAIRLDIGSGAKTLTSSEIDAVMKKIVAKLEKDLGVKVRK